MRLGIFSQGIARIPFLSTLAGATVHRLRVWPSIAVDAVAGWGLRPSTARARAYAHKQCLSYVALEDGFLRSFGTGETCPPLALVRDELGIYYDCTRPSALENLLNSDQGLQGVGMAASSGARAQLLRAKLSKYNHAPLLRPEQLCGNDVAKVLVVDQTYGDMSVALGGADERSFQNMVQAALSENVGAAIYVKTHPEVSSGRKAGYLTNLKTDLAQRIVVLRDAVNPISLIEQMDKVYVVSSTMGFEALLAGKPVSCFGVPWYAGWGVTDDRQPDHPAMLRRSARRGISRSVDDLFAAAYMQYTRYLNPETHQAGDISDVMAWLQRQQKMAQRFNGRMIVVGFRRWKAANVRSMLSLHPGRVIFVKNASAAAALLPEDCDCLVCWGRVPPAGLAELAKQSGSRLLRMEDGFIRSVGLGSDLIPPQSFVLDAKGIYFDPSQPSDLEVLLNEHTFIQEDLDRAESVRKTIIEHGITKYNIEPLIPVQWGIEGVNRQVVLVPGQVEDDASIRSGCDCVNGVHTNAGLLSAARKQFPNAFIVYKPHPDVTSGNRSGKLAMTEALQWADHVEMHASVVSCIEGCDTVVTMTSLTGFDALLREKQVVVYGRPFYAGWGLTQDMLPIPRRSRALSLNELVACALLHYPLYWDPVLKGYTSCEAVLLQIVNKRDRLIRTGNMEKLRAGYFRRQFRKLMVLFRLIRN
ncbi:capsular polysaccharide biosynthesis protein [Comamonas sp. UBA7528]|uniref:capsular polysaccharide biosynthesis protein n=1 Tax=Comamonas sp. UBA7528 TaxID=1946391 RepID=UPI0025BEB0CA|nr:capsular polysaccharide biosynthesis protein [Comamonas sp. UBA7528]